MTSSGNAFADWLRAIGLERYAAIFAENDIDFSVVHRLSEADLKELGLTLGHRKKFLEARDALQSGRGDVSSGATPASAASPALQASSGERRQLTVMFCDLVGSTALGERLDPEEFRALLHRYRTVCGEVIKRYDGFVARYVGDGILTYFGWPTAHEDDAERSVRAALEIVSAIKQVSGSGTAPSPGSASAGATETLAVRLGIATGPVVVGEQAGEGDQSKLAIGSTPNLAARLQGLAGGGEIVIAASTRRLIGNSFELDDLGDQELKGISEPVPAWRVVGLGVAASRFEASHGAQITPLVGREQELGLLLERWALAQDGEGQVVLLSGEPGIGKSRILGSLWERLSGQGAQALRFQCSPYYVNSAFYPSIDNFERALKFGRDESPESKLDKLEALIVAHYGRPLADVRFIAGMLSIPCEDRYGALTMTPQKFKDETLRSLVDLTEAAARKQPTVFLFEDAHWADPTSLEVMDLLVDRVKAIPLLIVLTHRPEFQNRWSSHGHVTALNLSKLTRTQSAAMIAKLTGGKALPAELGEQILSKTDGIPLFVEELTKSILESGQLKELTERYDYAGSAQQITIPTTLRDSLMARLDRYAPVKEIAQIGAAVGREFSYELIQAVAPMDPPRLDSALQQLTESGLAHRRGTPPDAVYTFKHALVQDAAYDSLLKTRRQHLHAKIARAIEERFPNIKETEPEVLAHHLTAAGNFEAAVPLWQKAGELALQRMALTESIAHLNRGLELIASLPASSERDASELGLRATLGTAWEAFKGWPAPELWDSLYPALLLAQSQGTPVGLLRVLEGLWIHVLCVGRVAESLRWVEDMLAAARATGDGDLLIVSHMVAMITNSFLGEFARSLAHRDQVLALYDEQKHRHLVDVINHDPKTVAGVWGSLALWILGYPDQAVRSSEEALAHARKIAHPFDLGFALHMGADPFVYRSEARRVRDNAEEIERMGRDNSMPVLWAMFAPIRLGIALIREGRAAEGIVHLKAGMTLWDSIGGKVYSPYSYSTLAEGTAMLGDIDSALQMIDQQIEQVERPGWEERVHYAEILRLKGWMLSLKDDSGGAEKNYLASLEVARQQQAKSWELRTSTSLARLWQSQGKIREANDLLAPIYNWFTEGFDTKDLIEAKALLEELAG